MIHPPLSAVWLLRLLPAATRELIQSDLEEEFHEIVELEGPRAGRLWFWEYAVRSVIDSRRGAEKDSGLRRTNRFKGGMMGDWIRDVRFGLRMTQRAPVVSLSIAGTMVLAIGAVSAVASLVYGVIMKPLPFPSSERIVQVARFNGITPPSFRAVGLPDFLAWEERSTSLAAIGGWTTAGATLLSGGNPVRVILLDITHGFPRVLGVSPLLGRFFDEAEYTAETGDVLVISHGFWLKHFGGDPTALGQTVALDGVTHTVVGVLPAMDLDYPSQSVVAWRPLAPPLTSWRLQVRGASWMNAIARVKEGVSIEVAQAEISALQARLIEEAPRSQENQNAIYLESLKSVVSGPAQQVLMLLTVAVAAILLIASANIAVLLLASANKREQEFAVRNALGGSSGQIVRQLLTESMVMGVIGGTLGLMAAPWVLRSIVALYPGGLPRTEEVHLSWPIVTGTVVVMLMASALAGLIPAVTASETRGRVGLTARGASDRRHRQVREIITAGQMAMSVFLLISAALFVQTLRNLSTIDPGFTPQGVVTFRVAPAPERYPDEASVEVFYAELTNDLRALPGVRSVGESNFVPFAPGDWGGGFSVVGEAVASAAEPAHDAWVRLTRADYYATLEIPVVRGRVFTEQDASGAAPVTLLNQEAATEVFGSSDPIGRLIVFEGGIREIVGVVGNVRHRDLGTPPSPEVHVPATQYANGTGAWVVVATDGEAQSLIADIRAVVKRIDSTVPLVNVATYEDRLSTSLAPQRFRAYLVTALGGLAALIALFGVYGVMSHTVGRMTREIGIRKALGEGRSSLIRRVMTQAGRISGAGALVGLLVTMALSGRLSEMMFGIEVRDTGTYLMVVVALWAVSLLAALGPALRASRVDPVAAIQER